MMDLSNILKDKILVFLEPPQHHLWNLLKPILSHDSEEIEFPFVDKTERGFEPKRVVVSQLEKYQQNWLLYRTTAEILKKWLFKHSAGTYSKTDDKNRILVERVEFIVSSETSKYFTIHQPEKVQAGEDSK